MDLGPALSSQIVLEISEMVYTPIISQLSKRKGGGHGFGRGGSHSSSSHSEGEGSSGFGKSSSSSKGLSSEPAPHPEFSVPAKSGKNSAASSYGHGGGEITTIPSGSPFAGREQGGGTRNQVYGTSVYGSGYPTGGVGRGVAGAGFPFYFWPLAWGGAVGYGAGYLHDHEYGEPTNSSRPGGLMTQVAIASPDHSATYHIVADDNTVMTLIETLSTNCTAISNLPLAALAYTGNASDPQPESAIQYYRASSVALTLDGYNNSAALSSTPDLPDTPLPVGLNATFLQCLNDTIGESVPLVNGVSSVQYMGLAVQASLALILFVSVLQHLV